MAKSPRTKMREYRARMPEEKKVETREKNKEHVKKYRANMTAEKRSAERISNTIRKREARMKKKSMKSIISKNVFSTVQAEGKAMKRVVNNLPYSPRRKVAVLKKLAIQHGILKDPPCRRNLFLAEDVEAVRQYYESDEVSRQCPGKKEFVTIRTENGKQQIQKKIMLMTVMEAFQMFKREKPNIKIGKSKFASLRPRHVVPITEKDHNVCCCIYHENYDLLINGLRRYNEEIPKPDELLASSMCSDKNISCSLGECESCKDVNACADRVMSLLPDQSSFSYYQWSQQSKKDEVHIPTADLKKEIVTQLETIRTHAFIAKIQLHQMKTLKKSLDPATAVLQEDFSENYCLKQQNEIMTAHWNQTGITIFTAIAYFSNTDFASFALISDCLDHNKFAVTTFNRIILKELENGGKKVQNLHVFSDGCGGQFKNCSNLSLLTTPKLLHPQLESLDWSFFATSHGKGPIDGIGGTVKRAVWRRVLREDNLVINTAEEFSRHAKEACPNINIIYVPKEVISEVEAELESLWATNTPKTIPQTRSFHYFRRESETSISASVISPFAGLEIQQKSFPIFKPVAGTSTTTEQDEDFIQTKPVSHGKKSLYGMDAIKAVQKQLDDNQNGQYFCVYYENTFYWGKSLRMFSDDPESAVTAVDFAFMHRKLDGFWDWPKLKDEKRVEAKFIFYGPHIPEPPSKKGFKFPDIQAEKQYRLFKKESILS